MLTEAEAKAIPLFDPEVRIDIHSRLSESADAPLWFCWPDGTQACKGMPMTLLDDGRFEEFEVLFEELLQQAEERRIAHDFPETPIEACRLLAHCAQRQRELLEGVLDDLEALVEAYRKAARTPDDLAACSSLFESVRERAVASQRDFKAALMKAERRMDAIRLPF